MQLNNLFSKRACVATIKISMDFLHCQEFLRCTNSLHNSPCVLVAGLVIKHQRFLQKMLNVFNSAMYYPLMLTIQKQKNQLAVILILTTKQNSAMKQNYRSTL